MLLRRLHEAVVVGQQPLRVTQSPSAGRIRLRQCRLSLNVPSSATNPPSEFSFLLLALMCTLLKLSDAPPVTSTTIMCVNDLFELYIMVYFTFEPLLRLPMSCWPARAYHARAGSKLSEVVNMHSQKSFLQKQCIAALYYFRHKHRCTGCSIK